MSTLSSSDRQNWPCKRKITGIGVISIDPVPNFQCSTKRRFTCLLFFFPWSCTCSLGCVKSCCKGLTQPAGDSLGMRIDDMTSLSAYFCIVDQLHMYDHEKQSTLTKCKIYRGECKGNRRENSLFIVQYHPGPRISKRS